jgi:hypothetical protein
MKGTERSEVGGVRMDIASVGNCRVKRVIYPVGFRWSKNMKPITHTEWCMHAHIGFLAQGEIHMEFSDGCVKEFRAPQVVSIEPEHDGWVVGNQEAVLIEFDFGGDTASRVGLPDKHTHSK